MTKNKCLLGFQFFEANKISLESSTFADFKNQIFKTLVFSFENFIPLGLIVRKGTRVLQPSFITASGCGLLESCCGFLGFPGLGKRSLLGHSKKRAYMQALPPRSSPACRTPGHPFSPTMEMREWTTLSEKGLKQQITIGRLFILGGMKHHLHARNAGLREEIWPSRNDKISRVTQ